jgi:hypothetical protein
MTRDSTSGRDMTNGVDVKKTTVRWHGGTYSAPIKRVHTKTGDLMVMCYERMQDKFYYFVIPNNLFQWIGPKSNIEIPFKHDGRPRYHNNCNVNWWNYKVDSFETMVTAQLSQQVDHRPSAQISSVTMVG